MWGSVRAEFTAFLGLMPLSIASWELPWSGVVDASDASEGGWGSCPTWWGAEVAALHGRVPERSRCK
eukprot:3369678-Pyramimonas_sp.AAC.1